MNPYLMGAHAEAFVLLAAVGAFAVVGLLVMAAVAWSTATRPIDGGE